MEMMWGNGVCPAESFSYKESFSYAESLLSYGDSFSYEYSHLPTLRPSYWPTPLPSAQPSPSSSIYEHPCAENEVPMPGDGDCRPICGADGGLAEEGCVEMMGEICVCPAESFSYK